MKSWQVISLSFWRQTGLWGGISTSLPASECNFSRPWNIVNHTVNFNHLKLLCLLCLTADQPKTRGTRAGALTVNVFSSDIVSLIKMQGYCHLSGPTELRPVLLQSSTWAVLEQFQPIWDASGGVLNHNMQGGHMSFSHGPSIQSWCSWNFSEWNRTGATFPKS